MSEYNINVNFAKGVIDSDLNRLVQNDYNTTKLKFKFDNEENRVVFKMLYPDGETSYITQITDDELIFGPGILSQSGTYEVEISLYTEDGRLTSYATMEFYVRNELFDSDEPVEPDDRVPILDQLITDVNTLIGEVDNMDIDVNKEDDVATVTITKKDGTEKNVEIYDGEKGDSGITMFYVDDNGHLIAESESASNYEHYSIDNTNGHLYLEIGE